MPSYRPAIERFIEKVQQVDSGCWEWTASKVSNGYGIFQVGEGQHRTMVAHRWFYQYVHGPVSEDLQLDHLCRNRACVNPEHLEPVTQSENLRRGYASRRAGVTPTCTAGHAITGRNRYVQANGNSRCRTCNNANNAARNRARRARNAALKQ